MKKKNMQQSQKLTNNNEDEPRGPLLLPLFLPLFLPSFLPADLEEEEEEEEQKKKKRPPTSCTSCQNNQ